jgi:uncharacterized protein with NAD-binding domain and iron-sulfur cluster
VQDAYRELQALGLRKPDDPLATWDQGLKPYNRVVMPEYVNGSWQDWVVDFAANDLVPGTPGRRSLWDYVEEIISVMLSAFIKLPYGKSPGCWGQIVNKFTQKKVATQAPRLIAELEQARSLARQAPSEQTDHEALIQLLDDFMEAFADLVAAELAIPGIRRLFILFELGYRNVRGILRDVLPSPERFDAINKYDYREWLRLQGTSEMTLNSAALNLVYNLPFAYPGGDTNIHGKIAAGAALYGLLRIVFDYKGAPMWKFEAGTGDTIIAPLYQVLQARGVKFEFFHRVKKLHVDDQHNLSGISMGRQVNLNPGIKEYKPLYDIKRLPSWPGHPLYDQIQEGERLIQEKINLESYWTPWQDVEDRYLVAGRDFDEVVLGISLGALPELCSELIDRSGAWQKLVATNKTNQTQAVQIWLKEEWLKLGSYWEGAVSASYVNPINSWADMSQILPYEDWPADNEAKSVAYFCGPMLDPPVIPPPTDHCFPEIQASLVEQMALQWLAGSTGNLWANATLPGQPGLRDGLLVIPCPLDEPADFQKQFKAQFWKANIDPSERYVLSAPCSIQHRLEPGKSDFNHLYLAGDWVRNSLNIGSVEGAVMTGLGAAQAIREALHLPIDKEVFGTIV